MYHLLLLLLNTWFLFVIVPPSPPKVFDVHLHASEDPQQQLAALSAAGVYKAAFSSSWESQREYRNLSGPQLLHGLMFPCPNGKVPYSLQPCFKDGSKWPSPAWVESEIRAGNIRFLGEVLAQYEGIAPSDSLFDPYYALAVRYNLPVGIHMGGAGPGHGCPDFKMELGNPADLENLLRKFPSLRLWIMHGGDQFYVEAIQVMRLHPQVFADISVLCNPDIVPAQRFETILKAFLDAGLEDRLMFGSDNGNIVKTIQAVTGSRLLSEDQKQKILYRNAERFFAVSDKL